MKEKIRMAYGFTEGFNEDMLLITDNYKIRVVKMKYSICLSKLKDFPDWIKDTKGNIITSVRSVLDLLSAYNVLNWERYEPQENRIILFLKNGKKVYITAKELVKIYEGLKVLTEIEWRICEYSGGN